MRGRVVGEKLTDDEVEAWNERAGILEFCAGFSRQDADRLARVMVQKKEIGMGQALTIHLSPREITCGICGKIDNHSNKADRRAVPIWNGEATDSGGQCDGYMAVCPRCYKRWDAWDERIQADSNRAGSVGR